MGSPYTLTADEWLRVLREQPLPNLPNVVYCPCCVRVRAYGFPTKVEIPTCHHCGGPVIRLEETFWRRLSHVLKRCYRRDKSLFARVKAEFPDWPFPTLEGLLSWVTVAWKQAPRPRGRPQDLQQRLFIAHWLHQFSGRRVVIEFLTDAQRGQGPTDQVIRSKTLPPVMSRAQAIDVLLGKALEDGRIFYAPSGRRRKSGGFPIRELEQLSETFRSQFYKMFGSYPNLHSRDIQRMCRWVEQFRADANFRIKGRKVRERKASRGVTKEGSNSVRTDIERDTTTGGRSLFRQDPVATGNSCGVEAD